jgi:hypothetical protein
MNADIVINLFMKSWKVKMVYWAFVISLITTAACLSGIITEEVIPLDLAVPGSLLGIMGIGYFGSIRHKYLLKKIKSGELHDNY